mgnify:CR=1 FL=1
MIACTAGDVIVSIDASVATAARMSLLDTSTGSIVITSWRAPCTALGTETKRVALANQAEIDAACEFIDFLRFNAYFMTQIYRDQPVSSPGIWNRLSYRPLEGFVYAVSPFNFTAIAGNLCASAAMMGNTVVWKPSDHQVFSANILMQIFKTYVLENVQTFPTHHLIRLQVGRGTLKEPQPHLLQNKTLQISVTKV